MAITAAQLRKFSPSASQKIIDGIVANQKLLVDAEITTPLRIRHFFAQIANESGGLAKLEENLSYSAKRLTEVWKKRFPTIAAATPYAKNPEKLANKVYGGRLGNNKPGDGWAYRGSGLMQTTGKANFGEVQKETGVQCLSQPALLRSFPGALQAACIYWKNNGINKFADRDDIVAVTKAVNGGLIGLDDRKDWLTQARHVWPDGAASAKPADIAAIPPIEPKPAPAPVPVSDTEMIKRVQAGLTLLNYQPGGVDGKLGDLTKGAILSFRNDTGLPPGDGIDADLIAALSTAPPRKMVPERANATQAQVAAVVPEANVHWWTKLGSLVLGGGVGGVGLLDQISPAVGYLTPVKDFIGDVPPAVWIGGIVLVCAALYLGSRYGANKATEAYQAGDRR